jgi:hypothetical protein
LKTIHVLVSFAHKTDADIEKVGEIVRKNHCLSI